MVVVTLQRNKCIGCNYCVEVAPEFFQMSKKDGKTVLLKSQDNRGFHTFKTSSPLVLETFQQAEKVCPVNIIKVKDV
ncbi:ferredoxin [Pseudoxanthomonas sp. SGD-10]|nr:ferredoxin [Pseudoxanthomonas sp. SGD-10]